ncbi:hypothetical protein MMC13_000048 [Lambiella insularis]|nr:hypothetical protein [Lambiella insularis]
MAPITRYASDTVSMPQLSQYTQNLTSAFQAHNQAKRDTAQTASCSGEDATGIIIGLFLANIALFVLITLHKRRVFAACRAAEGALIDAEYRASLAINTPPDTGIAEPVTAERITELQVPKLTAFANARVRQPVVSMEEEEDEKLPSYVEGREYRSEEIAGGQEARIQQSARQSQLPQKAQGVQLAQDACEPQQQCQAHNAQLVQDHPQIESQQEAQLPEVVNIYQKAELEMEILEKWKQSQLQNEVEDAELPLVVQKYKKALLQMEILEKWKQSQLQNKVQDAELPLVVQKYQESQVQMEILKRQQPSQLPNKVEDAGSAEIERLYHRVLVQLESLKKKYQQSQLPMKTEDAQLVEDCNRVILRKLAWEERYRRMASQAKGNDENETPRTDDLERERLEEQKEI